jgi:hypothetical protein
MVAGPQWASKEYTCALVLYAVCCMLCMHCQDMVCLESLAYALAKKLKVWLQRMAL